MKLFDLIGGKVKIHPDAIGIPCFRRVWDADRPDKEHATKVISYIVLMNKWDSPYVQSMDEDSRELKLKKEIFDDENYKLTAEELICEDEYKTLLNTRALQMLNNMRLKLDSVSKYYKESLDDTLDEKKIKDLLAGMEKVKGTYQTLDFLEKAVKTEELNNSKVRGGSEINSYELPK